MSTMQDYHSRLADPPAASSGPSPTCRRCPPEQVQKQVAYLIAQGWSPAIEHTEPQHTVGSYWYMWKLPMFGETSVDKVLAEAEACHKANPVQPRAPGRLRQACARRRARRWSSTAARPSEEARRDALGPPLRRRRHARRHRGNAPPGLQCGVPRVRPALRVEPRPVRGAAEHLRRQGAARALLRGPARLARGARAPAGERLRAAPGEDRALRGAGRERRLAAAARRGRASSTRPSRRASAWASPRPRPRPTSPRSSTRSWAPTPTSASPSSPAATWCRPRSPRPTSTASRFPRWAWARRTPWPSRTRPTGWPRPRPRGSSPW